MRSVLTATMIIDSHAYCWTPFDAPTPGFSGDEKMLLLQRAYASHHQPTLRINDGALGDSAVLLDSTGGQELPVADSRRLCAARSLQRGALMASFSR